MGIGSSSFQSKKELLIFMLTILKELQNTYGIGKTLANAVCAQAGVNAKMPINAISKSDWQKLIQQMENDFFLDTELKRLVQQDIQRFIFIGCYRGLRHHQSLPCRGQRTHTNAKTIRRKISKKNFSTF